MRPRLRRALARLAALALVAGVAVTVSSTTADAATMVRECKSSIGCVSFSATTAAPSGATPSTGPATTASTTSAYRLRQNGVRQLSAMGSGRSWARSAKSRGFRVDQTPRTGSVAQWNYGSAYAPS